MGNENMKAAMDAVNAAEQMVTEAQGAVNNVVDSAGQIATVAKGAVAGAKGAYEGMAHPRY